MAGDDPLLQFVGAFEDLEDLGVAVHLLEPQRFAAFGDLAGETECTVDLDGFADNVIGKSGAVGLCYRSFGFGAAIAAVEQATLDTMRKIVPGLDDETLFIDRTTTSWMEHWLGKEYGPAISTGQTPAQSGRNPPTVTTPITGLYLAGDCAGGRGVGTELAADSAMECAEQVIADLGHPVPTSWNTKRHRQPSAARSLRRVIRPSQTVNASGAVDILSR